MELTHEYLHYIAEIAPGHSAINQIRGHQIIALYSSPELHRLVGMDRDAYERIARNNAADLVVPDDMKGFAAAIQKCIATKKQFSYSWRARNPEQEFVWLFGTTSYLGELDGCPVMLSSFGASSQEMNLYKDIIDTSDTMAFVSDRDTYEMLYANRAARDYAGGTGVHMLGKTCYEYIRGRAEPCENCCINADGGLKASSCTRFSPLRGTWETVTSKRISWGGRNAVIHYIQDITKSKNDQKKLEDSEKRYATAVAGANLTVWEYRVKEHALVFDGSNAEKNGFPRRLENVPASLIPRIGEEYRQRLTEMYSRIDAGEQDVSEEFTWIPLPGKPPVSERIFYSLTRDPAGNPDIAYGISMDITAQKQEERQFQATLQAQFTANPDALCSYHLDLTKNLCLDAHGISQFILNELRSDTADGLFLNAAKLIVDPAKREEFSSAFNCRALIHAFESGKTAFHIDYRRLTSDRKQCWVRTFANMLRNPDSGDITAILYSVDINREINHTAVTHIIANQAYDYTMILHLDTGLFELEAISDSIAREFEGRFESGGELYDFSLLQEMSLQRLADKSERQNAIEASSVPRIRSEMERRGYYEFIMPVRFGDNPTKVQYRKFQHFYLSREDDTVLILGSDVTEATLRQKREAAILKAEAEHIQDIIDSVATGICVFRMSDPDHMRGEFVNLQMFRILGLTPPDSPDSRKEMMTDPMVSSYLQDPFLAVHPDDRARVRKTYRDNYDAKHFDGGRYRIVKKDGGVVWVSQDATLRESRPDYRVFYASYRVVDREVELQAELEKQLVKEQELRRQAEVANRAKTEFLSRMSHDMRTPLNGIIGITYLTKSETDPAKIQEDLEKIDTSSQFLLGLINDVLDMSKAESGKISLHPEPYPPQEFAAYLESVIKPLVSEKNQTIEYHINIPENAVPVQDKLRVNQVVFNILSNAVKFTPEGGRILYTATGEMGPGDSMCMHIQVSDNGVGMSKEFLKVIFDPFSQEGRNDISSQRGTGLGMSITKHLVDLMGGTIRVESEPGRGSTFFVDLPVAVIPAQAPSVRSADNTAAGGSAPVLRGKHILLCEDHPLNQEIAKKLLEGKGMLVAVAEDGKIGLETFKRSPAGFFDAILMDVRMPVMDGIEAAKAIRAQERPDAKTVPIIALTADAFAEDVQRCLRAGMCGHIAKPIDPERMYRTIETCMEQQGAGGAGRGTP